MPPTLIVEEVMATIPLLDEIIKDSRFIDLQKKEPMQAFALYNAIKQGLENEWNDFVTVRDMDRERFRMNVAKDGRIVAHLPQSVMLWINFIEQYDPSPKTVIRNFLMGHPEFCVRKMTVK
jgi:hypothetical protein